MVLKLRLKINILNTLNTFTDCTISSESLFTSTAVRTVTVGAVSVFITRTGFRRTLIDIWSKGKEKREFFGFVCAKEHSLKWCEVPRSTCVMKVEIFKVYVRVLWGEQTPYWISPGHTALKRKLQIYTEEQRKKFHPNGNWTHNLQIGLPSLKYAINVFITRTGARRTLIDILWNGKWAKEQQ